MPESQEEKLDELLHLARENNEMLHSMRRRMLFSQIFSYIYWLIIIGAVGWSYYFLEPYFQKYWQLYQNISTQLSAVEKTGLSIPADIKGILEKVQ
jgi:membrane protein required for beta-lactamase induction